MAEIDRLRGTYCITALHGGQALATSPEFWPFFLFTNQVQLVLGSD
jgi:hypothetical protein